MPGDLIAMTLREPTPNGVVEHSFSVVLGVVGRTTEQVWVGWVSSKTTVQSGTTQSANTAHVLPNAQQQPRPSCSAPPRRRRLPC